MKRDPLVTLGRLRRHAVDDARRALAEAERRVAHVEADLAALRVRRLAEFGPGRDHPDLLGRYLGRVRQREGRLLGELRALARERDAQATRLRDARRAMRQIERLAASRAERAARDSERRERRALDDLTLARRAAARAGG